jgi:predicted RNA methylase
LDGWEGSSRKIFKFISQTSDLILDIGAYTGAYSIIGLLANKSSRVMAFEPDLLQSEALRQNLTLNDLESRCQIYQIALSNKAGSVSFFQMQAKRTIPLHILLSQVVNFYTTFLVPQSMKL